MPRVLVVHDFAETFGGAERVTAELLAAFPGSELHVIAGRQQVAEQIGAGDRWHPLLPARTRLLRHYRLGAPLYPLLARRWRLPEADLVVSSSYGYAHGAQAPNRPPHLCYCHSPLRHVWSDAHDYSTGPLARPGVRQAFAGYQRAIRALDRQAAAGVDRFLTQSAYTGDQLRRNFGIEPAIVPPPVDVDRFRPADDGGHDGAFLFAGRLVEPYKRPGIVVEAFRRLPHLRLRIAGDGPARPALERDAPPNVTFLGALPTEAVAAEMRRAAAVVFPSVDDYGLIPVEAAASGRPVIAFDGGGARHTVVAGRTGVFFDTPDAEALVDAIAGFDPDAWDPATIRAHAEQWHPQAFRRAIRGHADELLRASGRPGLLLE
ncbi:glycosyltransferase [Patulibacter defluvii]|uniref:glycosyltransferase n=1 Tax=Patulibacter defluvii TaxID=3095358 RepID=UPI002A751572|nr:glycosyltransferase [Patulibacter sp. DM4]